EDFDHWASSGKLKVLVNECIGDELSNRDLRVHGRWDAQRPPDLLTARQLFHEKGDQATEAARIASLPLDLGLGFRAVRALVKDQPHSLPAQPRKYLQIARKQNCAKVGNTVRAAVGSPHQPFFGQTVENGFLSLRWLLLGQLKI